MRVDTYFYIVVFLDGNPMAIILVSPRPVGEDLPLQDDDRREQLSVVEGKVLPSKHLIYVCCSRAYRVT